MFGKLAPNSSHLTKGLVKYVPNRGHFRAVPSQNGENLTFVSEGGIASKDGQTFSRTISKARATSTLAFRVTSDAGDDGMVSRQTASPNASQSPLLSLVRRTAYGPISPGVTSLCEPTCEVALSFHFGFVRLI